MLRALPGTLFILVNVAMLAVTFAGVGLLVRRGFGVLELDLDDLLFAYWIGFGAVILLLLLWNFVLPVGPAALAVVVTAGAAGLVRSRRALPAALAEWRALPWWAMAAPLVMGLWVANLSLGDMHNWDSALYHMQGVEWARHYRAPPGLANLFGPLGFNNASLLYDALLDVGPWEGRAWHVANAVPIVVLATQALLGGARLLSGRREATAADLFLFLLLGVALSVAMDDGVASFATDVPETTLRLALAALWYRALTAPPRRPLLEAYDLVSLVLLAATAVAIKMNAAIFAVAAVAAASGAVLQRGRAAGLRRRTAVYACAIAATFALAWAGRGVVLSGYPLFPSRVLAAPVAWRVPAEHAQAEFDYVVHSGRGTVSNGDYVAGRVHGLGAWLPGWAARASDNPYYVVVPGLLILGGLPLLLIARRRAGDDQRRAAVAAWWMLPPTALALAAWFAVAPEPRYATPITWTLASLVAAQAWALGAGRLSDRRRRQLVGAMIAVGVSPLVINPLVTWRQTHSGNPLVAIVKANLRIPPAGAWLVPASRVPIVQPFPTRSGLVIAVPDERCWDSPPPCSPNPAANLRLRVPGRLDAGFVVDGPWAMEHWPEKWRPKYLAAWRASQPPTLPRTE